MGVEALSNEIHNVASSFLLSQYEHLRPARIRRRIRLLASRHEYIYMPLAKLIRPFGLANLSTDLIVEGYPRSGNSFLEALISLTQRKTIAIAHHTHALAHVRWGARHGIPSAVVVRNPIASAASLAMHVPKVFTADDLISEYNCFYEGLSSVREMVCLITFDSLTSNAPQVIRAIDARFSLGLDYQFSHTEIELPVFEQLNRLSSERGTVVDGREPYSPDRTASQKAERARIKKCLEGEIASLARRRNIDKANTLYEAMKKSADI